MYYIGICLDNKFFIFNYKIRDSDCIIRSIIFHVRVIDGSIMFNKYYTNDSIKVITRKKYTILCYGNNQYILQYSGNTNNIKIPKKIGMVDRFCFYNLNINSMIIDDVLSINTNSNISCRNIIINQNNLNWGLYLYDLIIFDAFKNSMSLIVTNLKSTIEFFKLFYDDYGIKKSLLYIKLTLNKKLESSDLFNKYNDYEKPTSKLRYLNINYYEFLKNNLNFGGLYDYVSNNGSIDLNKVSSYSIYDVSSVTTFFIELLKVFNNMSILDIPFVNVR